MLDWRNGRRARFRCECPKGCEGSTPSSSTMMRPQSHQQVLTNVHKERYNRVPSNRHGNEQITRLLPADHRKTCVNPRTVVYMAPVIKGGGGRPARLVTSRPWRNKGRGSTPLCTAMAAPIKWNCHNNKYISPFV